MGARLSTTLWCLFAAWSRGVCQQSAMTWVWIHCRLGTCPPPPPRPHAQERTSLQNGCIFTPATCGTHDAHCHENKKRRDKPTHS